jgi:uncharacterized protein (TIGR02246 family)
MKPNLRIVAVLAVCAFTSTAVVAQTAKPQVTPKAAAPSLSTEDEQAIRKVIAGTAVALNAHDMKAFAILFREDAEWINIVGMHWHGRDAVLAAHTAFLDTVFKDNRMKVNAIETRSLGNGYATAVATVTHGTFTTPDGRIVPEAQNRVTHVLVKGSDGWKIVHGHNVQVDVEAARHDPVNRNDGPVEKDVKALQGRWMTIKLVTDGKVEIDLKEPSKEGPVSTLTYNSHKWVLKLGDQEIASGTSKFDPSKSPKHIDLVHESGPLKGETVLGIYKLFGDEYTGCIAAPGKARPTEFASQVGSGQRLVISKREKR